MVSADEVGLMDLRHPHTIGPPVRTQVVEGHQLEILVAADMKIGRPARFSTT
jgi:hypothetical protein